MKVIMFAQSFPRHHWRAGDPTWFVEKINFGLKHPEQCGIQAPLWTPPKYHTIRAGERWKVGEQFSGRIWSDKPYRSIQQEIAQLQIKSIWSIFMNNVQRIWIGNPITGKEKIMAPWEVEDLANNDGLALDDFYSWFDTSKKSFKGQIICWNEQIKYAV